jgi:hypothetical protein
MADTDASEYSPEEAARRRDAVIKLMLSKPPEPHKKPQSGAVKGKESSPRKATKR